jgi:uncharacterized Fe-S cluster protein YjdI
MYDEGKTGEALALLRDTLVIPATLCFICNAPCEKICRKGAVNKPVAVREIKKSLVAMTDLDTIVPSVVRSTMKIAVIGSDPASLSLAYHLCKYGYAVTMFEPSKQILVPYIQAENVPADILELETEVIKKMGIRIEHTSEQPSADIFDGIVNPKTKSKQPARMVLEGRRIADSMHASLSVNQKADEDAKAFNSTYSRFTEDEKKRLNIPSVTTTDCLYCDCEGKNTCRLRHYATEYGIKSIRYLKDGVSEALRRIKIGENIRFEPAKCIKCGLCVYNSDNGFTFAGRGFVMQTILPEGNETNINTQITELCPTSALYYI